MGSFLACYDYGQGGVWFYVEGEDIDQVSRQYPDLLFFLTDPPWWNEEWERTVRAHDIAHSPYKEILERARKK